MGELTTIAVHKSTLKRLKTFKEYGRESYDEILNKIMALLNLAAHDDEGELTDEAKRGIAEGRADAKAGRVYTTKELMKKLGIE